VFNLRKAVNAIREEELSGWLFYNIHHRDIVADLILGIDKGKVNTRPWVYIVPAHGMPVKIVNAIESEVLDELPGREIVYGSREDFLKALGEAAEPGHSYAAQFSAWDPEISFLDHGTAGVLKAKGFNLVSAENLILKFSGLLDDAGMESHEKAGKILYEIVNTVWSKIFNVFLTGKKVCEGDVRQWILKMFDDEGLITESAPIVAAGRNSSNPHYMLIDGGIQLKRDTIVQFDIWARLKSSGAVYADISWVGYLGSEVPEEMERLFNAVKSARDETVNFIAEGLEKQSGVTGADADRKSREVLIKAGYEDYIRHRTGHSIGTEVHGFGINLDSVEFPDERNILNGSCFSVEPGVYLPKYGMRTEIDVYIKKDKIYVSGGKPQEKLLHL